jgi:hypothetical protein
MARSLAIVTYFIILSAFYSFFMASKRAAPNYDNLARDPQGSAYGYSRDLKRPRLSYNLSYSHQFAATTPAPYGQGHALAYPSLNALEEGPSAPASHQSQYTWNSTSSGSYLVCHVCTYTLTLTDQCIQATDPMRPTAYDCAATPSYPTFNTIQPSYTSYTSASLPSASLSGGNAAHSTLLAASFESHAFKSRLQDPNQTIFFRPPLPNDQPAAYALDSITSTVSFWCSRCHSWVGTKSKDPNAIGRFTTHIDGAPCLAQYARNVGLRQPLVPGSTFSLNSVFGTHPPQAISTQNCPGIIIPWEDDIFDTYVWHQHAQTSRVRLPWVIDMVDARQNPELIYARSRRCQGAKGSSGEPCLACMQVLPDIREKLDAAEWKKGTNDDRLHHRALLQVAHMLRTELGKEQQKVHNLIYPLYSFHSFTCRSGISSVVRVY